MSDQAQGLRALADQARRDQCGLSLSRTALPQEAPSFDGVPDSGMAAVSQAMFASVAEGIGVTDARLHALSPPLHSSAEQRSARKRTSPPYCARVIAVTSGKGGVGKTNFSTNLSLTLAQSELRVIVLDADLGLANLHVVMGIAPQYHLEHVMRGEKTLREVLFPGPGGVHIIGGGSGITELANLEEEGRRRFIHGLTELDSLADVILIDTGAGLSRNVLAFLCAVEEIIVLTTPEPTAITDAYATIKVVSQENPSARLRLVVNMAQSQKEAEAVAERLMQISRRFLCVELDWLGFIPQDTVVTRAVRAQQPFVLTQPTSAASQAIGRIASSLGFRENTREPAGMGGFLNRIQRFFGC